jgi:DNA-binding IclR family transcriptional regulator
MSDSNKRPVQAVQITCNIIVALQKMDGAGVTELANELDNSKSTIHNHLQTLNENHLIVSEGRKYRLSLRFLDIADHVRGQFGNYNIIKKELDSLAEETGEVSQFGIAEHGRVSYLYKAIGDRGVKTASTVGTQQDIHSTALGKAILSHLPERRVEEIIDQRGLPAKTNNTITDADDLFDELETIREQGFAIDNEENITGLKCIAAPVLGNDSVKGAVSVSYPISRITGDSFTEELSAVVKRSANVIELNSKFS